MSATTEISNDPTPSPALDDGGPGQLIGLSPVDGSAHQAHKYGTSQDQSDLSEASSEIFFITELIVEGITEEYSNKNKGKALKLTFLYTWGTEVSLVQTSPTTWKHSGLITLPSDIAKLTCMVHSRHFIACAWLSQTDLDHFRENKMLKHRFLLRLKSTPELQSITVTMTIPILRVQHGGDSEGKRDQRRLIQASDTSGPIHECPIFEIHENRDSDSGPDHLLASLSLLSDSYPQKGYILANYGNKLWEEFTQKSNSRDLDNSILAYKQAVKGISDNDRHLVSWLDDLRILLNTRFDHTRSPDDLTEAISTCRLAVQLASNGSPDLPLKLLNLGALLQILFDQTGVLNDLIDAISFKRSSVQLTTDGDPNLPVRLGSLGESLQNLFNQTGVMADLSEATSLFRQAIQLVSNSHPNLSFWLNSLGAALYSLYDQTGVTSDLSEIISSFRQSVQLTPDGDPRLPSRLNNLGVSLQILFEHTGVVSDLSEAISYKRRVVQLTSDDDSNLPSWLANLGVSLLSLFNQTEVITDLLEAISVFRQAIQLTPDGHPHLPLWLNNLGGALQKLYEQREVISDLSEAVSSYRYAVQLTPESHPKMSSRLGNLGVSLQSLYYQTEDINNLAEAISVLRQAAQLTPDSHPYFPIWLNNLGNSLQSLFNQTGDINDLSEAIASKKHAVDITPEGHPDLPSRLHGLGISFELQFTQSQNQVDIHSALSLYKMASASQFGAALKRLLAARQWVRSSELHDPMQLLDAYGAVINLVTQVAGMDQTIELRHQTLKKFSALTSAAATAALRRSNSELAVEWLEQGHCITWNQLNQLRSPLDHLYAEFPDIAHQFQQLSEALENAGSRQIPLVVGDSSNSQAQKVSLADEAHAHIKLAEERDHLLDEIRHLPQFGDFLRPRKASSFHANLPSDGPIIVVNAHRDRCDAIALINGSDAPLHIPLENLTFEDGEKMHIQLARYLTSKGIRMRDADRAARRSEVTGKGGNIYQILKKLWLNLVKPILDGVGYNKPTTIPRRIWWCMTGPFTFLPIHAAGIYEEEGPCISNFAVSSYIPTVSMLVDKINDKIGQAPSRLLLVSQAKAPELPRIPNTEEETSSLSTIMHKYGVDALRLNGDTATIVNVEKEILSYNSIHLACHGIQDIKNPLKSGFCLGDGRLELSEIMKKQIPHADLAFLSACQTSKGDMELTEEAIHLAAGMLAAGYRSVVATMWAIKDEHGPAIAEEFYKHMLENDETEDNPCLDGRKAAYALHHATQTLRKKLGDTEEGLLAWLPYVHYGV